MLICWSDAEGRGFQISLTPGPWINKTLHYQPLFLGYSSTMDLWCNDGRIMRLLPPSSQNQSPSQKDKHNRNSVFALNELISIYQERQHHMNIWEKVQTLAATELQKGLQDSVFQSWWHTLRSKPNSPILGKKIGSKVGASVSHFHTISPGGYTNKL